MLFQLNGTEKFRLDSAGRLLVGHTSSNDSANFAPVFQIEGTDSVDSSMSLIRNGDNAHPPYLTFGKSRGTSNGADTIVQDSDTLGSIDFWGADGSTAWAQASKITASIDGTPGSNVTPGKLRFWTTPASSGTSQERLRIDSSGRVLIGSGSMSLPKGSAAGSMDLDNGSITMCVGGNINSTGRTNSTDKINRITSPHYTNAEEPVALISSYNVSGNNSIAYGGGSSLTNAVTYHSFYTAADTTTTTGSERLRIDSNGLMGLGVTPTSHNNTTAFQIYDDYNSAGYPRIRLTNQSSGTASSDGYEIILNGSDLDAAHRLRENADIYFMTNNNERLRIT